MPRAKHNQADVEAALADQYAKEAALKLELRKTKATIYSLKKTLKARLKDLHPES